MRSIKIRVDGSPSMGMGHIFRCVSLAQMLKALSPIEFYCKEFPTSLKSMFSQLNIPVQLIVSESAFLDGLSPLEIVVLDGYQFESSYQKLIKDKGCSLICIDDLIDKHFYADIIINHAPGISASSYMTEPYTRLLLGPRFALLRPDFLSQAGKTRSIGKLENVLINFGGSDFKNLTMSVLNLVFYWRKAKMITVVTGHSYCHRQALLDFIGASDGLVRQLDALSEEEMLAAFLQAQLAIIPSSTVLFEAVATRTPCVSGYYVENQKKIYEGFKEKGVFFDAEDFSELSLSRALQAAQTADPMLQIKNQMDCIDGKSAERIVQAVQAMRVS